MAQTGFPHRLAKMLTYMLGRRPDEMGLVPDPDGWVKVKELLKALSEEEGWRHVRRSHIDEVLITLPDPPMEVADNKIRAVDRSHLSAPRPLGPGDLPKLLYTCVRRRAHGAVVERGIDPGPDGRVVLAENRETAERIGRRIDGDPVLLTVQTAAADAAGVAFKSAGEGLFIADRLPPRCFTAPPVPEKKPSEKAAAAKPKGPTPPHPDRMPGSYIVTFERERDRDGNRDRRHQKQDKVSRDRDKKRARREKQQRRWSDS